MAEEEVTEEVFWVEHVGSLAGFGVGKEGLRAEFCIFMANKAKRILYDRNFILTMVPCPNFETI